MVKILLPDSVTDIALKNKKTPNPLANGGF